MSSISKTCLSNTTSNLLKFVSGKVINAPIFYGLSALSGDRVALAGYREGVDVEQGLGSLYIEYHPRNSRGKWSRRFVPEWIVALSPFKNSIDSEDFAAITMQNSILLFGGREAVERLPSDEHLASGLGQVRGRLYACTFEGKTFIRGDKTWKELSHSLYEHASFYEKFIVDVRGPEESEVYFSGRGGLGFWDGSSARRLDAPRDLTEIFVASPSEIWVCGWDGTLLRGNYKDGFRKIPTRSNVSFSSVTMFGDMIYLGGTENFYCFDGKRLLPVETGLDPEPRVIRQVAAGGDALWGIGDRDFIRFDGRQWSRIPYPDTWHDGL